MIFAGIDVNIITHARAYHAGPEAMGLWVWSMCYAQVHETDGHVPRMAALAAWAGRRNIMLAKRLVESGLWVERGDGDWTIWNYGKKNQSADEIQRKKDAAKQRKERWLERKENATGTRSKTFLERDGTLLPPPPPPPPPIGVAPDTLGTPAEPGSPPPWFSTAVDVIAMGTGITLPVAEAWLRYDGHRAGKGIAPTAKDAQYWLTTVMVPEAREVARRNASDDKRTQAFVQQRSGPEVKPQDSRKQFREREDWERTAGPPDPETAAKMQALLGKVGT